MHEEKLLQRANKLAARTILPRLQMWCRSVIFTLSVLATIATAVQSSSPVFCIPELQVRCRSVRFFWAALGACDGTQNKLVQQAHLYSLVRSPSAERCMQQTCLHSVHSVALFAGLFANGIFDISLMVLCVCVCPVVNLVCVCTDVNLVSISSSLSDYSKTVSLNLHLRSFNAKLNMT